MTNISNKEVTNTHALLGKLAVWFSYYRANPQIFARDYLNLTLKPFQKILLYQMNHNDHFMYIGSRGQGKTYLTAIFIVIRCILYPGTKVIIASGIKRQAIEVIDKILDDLMTIHDWGSANLRNEISFKSNNVNNPEIKFHNGSFIKVVTANDNARGARGNILIVDEFRLVPKEIIDTVLKKFLTAPRQPRYLNKPEYQDCLERNIEMYCSSAWFQSHWSYTHYLSYFKNMLDMKRKYYVASVPYQMAIKERLLAREAVEDDMSEANFNPISWSYEMESLFYGASEDAFFDYETLNDRRLNMNPFYPIEYYLKKNEKPPKRIIGERRILSVDIALMSSTKNNNDASSLIINSAIPLTDTEFTSNIVYLRNLEGLTTDVLGMEIMKTFYDYDCTDLVVDLNGRRMPF